MVNNYGSIQGGIHNYGGVQGDVNNNYYASAPPKLTFFGVPPLPAYGVFGRSEALADLEQQLLAGAETIALEGQGGIGKTTMAAALAYNKQVLAKYSGGVLWASVGPSSGEDTSRRIEEIVDGWAKELGVTVAGSLAQRIASLQSAIAARPLLLIVDDVWDEAVAQTMAQLRVPGCAMLLTTRDRNIARHFSPQRVAMRELSTERSVDLLAHLCQDVANLSRPQLERIAVAVGGLPLALTLIGGYVADRSDFAATAASALDITLEELLNLKVASRHLALDEVISLSVDALPDAASRAAFCALAPFAAKPETFTLEAALAVIGTSDASVVILLLNRNLLEKAADERITIHQVVAVIAVAEAGPMLAQAQERHARYYLELMQRNPKDSATIGAAWAQIRQAWLWVSSAKAAESLVLPYVWAAKSYQEWHGLWDERLAWCQHGLHVAQATGNRFEEASLLSGLGNIYRAQRSYVDSLTTFGVALAIFQELQDSKGAAIVINNMGTAYADSGDEQQALACYQQALPMQQQLGDEAGAAATLSNIGTIHLNRKQWQQALDAYNQALPIRRKLNQGATTLSNMGLAYYNLGDKTQAQSCWEQSLALQRQIDDQVSMRGNIANLAHIHQEQGNYATAVALLEELVQLDTKLKHSQLNADQARLAEAKKKLAASSDD